MKARVSARVRMKAYVAANCQTKGVACGRVARVSFVVEESHMLPVVCIEPSERCVSC